MAIDKATPGMLASKRQLSPRGSRPLAPKITVLKGTTSAAGTGKTGLHEDGVQSEH